MSAPYSRFLAMQMLPSNLKNVVFSRKRLTIPDMSSAQDALKLSQTQPTLFTNAKHPRLSRNSILSLDCVMYMDDSYQKFARIAALLKKRLQKYQPIGFSPLDETKLYALKTLNTALVQPPVVELPHANGHLSLDTDVCDVQVGCVLLRMQQDDTLKPVRYWSRSLNDAKRKNDTTQKECLTTARVVPLLRPYLEDNKFTTRTDHNLPNWILNLSDSSGQLTMATSIIRAQF